MLTGLEEGKLVDITEESYNTITMSERVHKDNNLNYIFFVYLYLYMYIICLISLYDFEELHAR